MEESEGYFDINNDQIVLKGTNLGLNDGIELGFAEHEGLPNKIKSFATYKVANLTEMGRETTFNLTNKKGKVILVKLIVNSSFSPLSVKPGAIRKTKIGIKISTKKTRNKSPKTRKLKTLLANLFELSFPFCSSDM